MTEDQNKIDILLTITALAVQSTEALSECWPRQKELLALISDERREMVMSFYNNGYFVSRGPAWDQFVIDAINDLGINMDSDGMEYLDPNKRTLEVLYPLARAKIDMELVLAAFNFVDAFDESER